MADKSNKLDNIDDKQDSKNMVGCSKDNQMDNTNIENENSIVTLDMCYYCFDVLSARLNGTKEPDIKFPDEFHPIFVTWSIGKEEELRGCIGSFIAKNLNFGIRYFAIQGAEEDPRFDPITIDELSELHVSVSILKNFEEAANYLDWEQGKHGIVIDFKDNDISRNSTFLPEVLSANQYDKIEKIHLLIEKTGYKGTITQNLLDSIKLTRYQSEKLQISYQDYIDHCKKRKN